ncbi:hypothetical protein ACFVIM_11935 [Streptomyces sp. NPDC057638]|uniref:hypothetical protein n=1 Tax=Streptomyces sp. NPDC057638 TaxID=3346190 RepID=UPI0036787086
MTVAVLALGLAATGALPATAAGNASGLLPHPGPDGLVWVEEAWGDGGLVSGGAYGYLPIVFTVACEGGGSLVATMESQGAYVATFTVDCPAGSVGVGSVTLDPGIVRPGSFTLGIDASAQRIRWGLAVTQPE